MANRHEASVRSPEAVNGDGPQGPAAERERGLLLECRLEQMRSALDDARKETDRARMKLAEASAREADHARRLAGISEDLAEARAEIAGLHRHLERSEALRADLAGHLFEGNAHADVLELMHLRQKALLDAQRALMSERTVSRLRARVEELVWSRETLLTRLAEWQQLVRRDGPEAADLSEFLAELRREILDLEHGSIAGDARERELRARLARAGIDPDTPAAPIAAVATAMPSPPEVDEPSDLQVEAEDEPDVEDEPTADAEPVVEVVAEAAPTHVKTEAPARPARSLPAPARPAQDDRIAALTHALQAADLPHEQTDLLLKLGRSGSPAAAPGIHPWTESTEPSVRAAAYEALGRLLERSPDALEPYLRAGLVDADARVRRRVVLAAATARGLSTDALLEPLREDPDAQVRRVVRQVLRQVGARPDVHVPDATVPKRSVGG